MTLPLYYLAAIAPTLLISGALLALLSRFAARHAPLWDARGIHPGTSWRRVGTLQAAAGITATLLIAPTWGAGPAVAASAFAWLAVLAVATDLATRKIPWEVSHPVAGIGITCAALSWTVEGALAFAASLLGLVALPYLARALTHNGLGLSDVRLLWAATATLSWWIGQTWLLYALLGACALQLLVRLVAPHLGWGDMTPVPGPQKHPATPAPAPRDTISASHAPRPDTRAPDTGPGERDAHAPSTEPTRLRRELPFAPALVLAITLATTYGTVTATGACTAWNITGIC